MQVERANVDALRPRVLATAATLRNSKRAFREKRASQLNRQVRVLNTKLLRTSRDRYRGTRAWFRPIIRFLQRRHLLAGAR